jgi:hypothetical protein
MVIFDACLYFIERDGVAQGISWRLGYRIVMTWSNVDGLLEHIKSSPKKRGYRTITFQMLAYMIQVQSLNRSQKFPTSIKP